MTGKYHVQDNTEQAYGQLRIDHWQDGSTLIAWEQTPDHPCPQEVRKAAYMFAAADEMLDALKWVRLAVNSGMPHEAWPKCVMNKVHDAIRKAETVPTPPPVPVECIPCTDPY